jgi:hypothetical protein
MGLSKNPNITWEIVEANPFPNPDDDENTWHFGFLSENPNITWEIVEQHPEHEDYNYEGDDFIDAEIQSWNYDALSENPSITWDIFIQNRDRPWDFPYLNLKKDREKYIMSCLNKDRYNTRKALMPINKEELITGDPTEDPKQNLKRETVNKVFGNPDIMRNIMPNLGGRKKQGKKTIKKRKTNRKPSRKSKKSRRRM